MQDVVLKGQEVMMYSSQLISEVKTKMLENLRKNTNKYEVSTQVQNELLCLRPGIYLE